MKRLLLHSGDIGGGLVHMSRKIESMCAELRGLSEDVHTIDQRIYETLRGSSS